MILTSTKRSGRAPCRAAPADAASPTAAALPLAPMHRPGRRVLGAAVCVAALLLIVVGPAAAQGKRDPRPAATPDRTAELLDDLRGRLQRVEDQMGAIRAQIPELDARVQALPSPVADLKVIAEASREEVRGLYVDISKVRGDIAGLEESSGRYSEEIGRSRYLLTLLLVAIAVLQLLVLAVLLRSR